MQKITFSIIIPALNEEKYIKQTLLAVSNLKYKDYEIIVVDNGSVDKTVEIASEFKNVKIVYENNKGLPFARERGYKESSGNIIANIDADCHPPKDWLNKAIVYFQDPLVVGISGPFIYYDGGYIFNIIFGSKFTHVLLKITSDITYFFTGHTQFYGGNMLIRRFALDKAGGYNTNVTFHGEDTETGRRISKYGKTLFIRTFIMYTSARRFYTNGIMKTSFEYIFTHFKILIINK